jgi:hypothetical protein
LESQYRLANAITDQHRYGEAERLYLETLVLQRRMSRPSVHCEYQFESGPTILGPGDAAMKRSPVARGVTTVWRRAKRWPSIPTYS